MGNFKTKTKILIEMKLVFIFILLSSICFGQSKKEQIEALNVTIDSLYSLLSNTRNKSVADIHSLNDKIKQISDEITTLKTLNNKLTMELDEVNSKIPPPVCASFFNFSNLLSVVEMDKLYKCVPPSLIKAEFYKRYYEILAIEFIEDEQPTNLSKVQLINLFHTIEHRNSNKSLKDVISETSELDLLMENYKNGNVNSKSVFHEALFRFYFEESFGLVDTLENVNSITEFEYSTDLIFPSMYISRIKDYIICTAFNAGQAGDFPHGGIYEINENQFREVWEAEILIGKIESKLEKIFGSNCYSVIPYGKIELVNSQFQITLPIYSANDATCCNSGYCKITTSDFWSYESLFYSRNEGDEQPLKWIKL